MTLSTRLIVILFLSGQIAFYGQNKTIDSLKLALKNAKHDTVKCNLLNELIEYENDDSVWTKYNKQLFDLASLNLKLSKLPDKINRIYQKHIANAFNNWGYLALIRGENEKALNYWKKSLMIREKINDKPGIAFSLNNIGGIYQNKGDIQNALNYHSKSLKIWEEIKDKNGISQSLNNIAVIYNDQGEINKSLIFLNKSLKIQEEINNKEGIAIALNNIGVSYKRLNNLTRAKQYYDKSLKIREEIGDKRGIAYALNNIGYVLEKQGDLIGAQKKYTESLKLMKEIGDKKGVAILSNSLGKIYFSQSNTSMALDYLKTSMKISKELGYPEDIRDAALILQDVYKYLNNYKLALENHELYIKMRDSLNNIETQKVTITQQTKYEYDKQKIIEDEKHAAELKIQSEKAQADKKRQNIIIASVSIVLLLVAFFSVMLYNRFKTTHKQKLIIEKKEKETLEQKQLIEEKQKEITDSINYAQKIQEAYMPPVGALQYCFKNSFLFFQPKDVVSGDFYYINNPLDENGNRMDEVYIAAADCTGHGVPGSIMSIICCNALNEAILTKKIRDTGKILDESREIIIRNLKSKNGSDRKDGMDICLLRINKKTNEVQFSGANNPFWFISNNNLEEIKGNKQPVGLYENMSPFDTHTITLPTPSQLFLFTDGYADQFGGPRGKKYKYTQLKEFLLSNSELSMQEHHKKLKTEFESWKGDLEQVDDVCMIGIII